MKIFVLGCNGMAGHLISLYFCEKGYKVTGFARSESRFVPTIVGDAYDTSLLSTSIIDNDFDVVINCIGMLNQFAENDKAAAVFMNGYLPHFLAKITENIGTRIIHMSTDCVFSGNTGPYSELSFPDGKSYYDRTKAMGEIVDSKNLTLRNSIVGPDIKENGIGLLNWFMQQNGRVNGYTKAMWTGQTTLQLAKTMEVAIKAGATGLINAVPDSNISKYDLLNLFNRYLRNNQLIINPVDGVVLDKTLVRTNYELDYIIPDYETMVSELAEWMTVHKDLYPHYNV